MTFIIVFIYWTGETDDNTIKAVRSRQMKNFHLALMISQVMHLKANFMSHMHVICPVLKLSYCSPRWSYTCSVQVSGKNFKFT